MERYEKYKDSGVEWIGEIPEGWEVKKLKYVTSINDDTLAENTDGDFEIEYVDISNVKSGLGILATETYAFSKAPSRARRVVQNGDVIVSTVRTYLKSISKINNQPDNLIVSTGFAVIRSKEIKSDYIGFLFYSEFLIGEIISRSTGVSYPAINASEIGEIFIQIPDEGAQTAIANYLDRKTAEIDELIAQKERLLELYEEEKNAIINQAVTKGIDPDVKLKDSGIDWIGEIPDGWSSVSLRWISNIYSGGTPSKNESEYWKNGTIPWLNSGTVNQEDITEPSEYITEEALENSSAKWIPEKALVMALAGQGKTKGMVAQVQFKTSCNQSLGVIVPNEKFENRFLMYWLRKNYQNIRNLGGGDKRDGINLEMIGGIPIPLIDLQTQTAIVNHIETETARINAKIAKTKKIIALQKEYRTALISEVVTGKIKVTQEAAE